MRRLLLLFILGITTLCADSGEKIYQAKCVMCHTDTMPAKISQMKAPPMPQVVMHLKSTMQTKKEFVTFVNEYIQNPIKTKGLCREGAFQRFGIMPPIGADMTNKERESVALWLYEHYKYVQHKRTMKCGTVMIPTH